MMTTVEHNGIYFSVGDKTGTLIDMSNSSGDNNVDVFIPRFLPDGTEILSLGATFCRGYYKSITISDEIQTVSYGAFDHADVEEVVWSSSCKTIPAACFFSSSIKKISNIEHVDSIGVEAFKNSNIEEIKWPSGCQTIPQHCFYLSCLKKITNLDNVKTIQDGAFSCCDFESFSWPLKCNRVPRHCFCSCVQLAEVKFHNNVEFIENYAFEGAKIGRVDLSELMFTRFSPYAFEDSTIGEIIRPYYIDEEELEMMLFS